MALRRDVHALGLDTFAQRARIPYLIVWDALVSPLVRHQWLCVAAERGAGVEEEPLVLVVGKLLTMSAYSGLHKRTAHVCSMASCQVVGRAAEVRRGSAGVNAGVEPHHLGHHGAKVLVLDGLRSWRSCRHVGAGVVVGILCAGAGHDVCALRIFRHLGQKLIGVSTSPPGRGMLTGAAAERGGCQPASSCAGRQAAPAR